MMSPYFFGAYVMLDTYAVGLFTDMMIPLDIIRYSSIYILKLIWTHLFACNRAVLICRGLFEVLRGIFWYHFWRVVLI